jgi:ABC-type multidrug transport system ATPase subunit
MPTPHCHIEISLQKRSCRLIRLLLGMLRRNGGEAEVLGCPVADADRDVWSRVGHLIETPPRYGGLTVAESVYSAARLQGWDRRSSRVATAAIIADRS